MTEEESVHRYFWIVVACAVIIIFTTCVVKPVVTKIKSAQTKIESVDYSDTK